MASSRIPWADDEIIVAAELLVRRGWSDLREGDPEVISLSQLLRSLPTNQKYVSDAAFRSPKSVSRKISDLFTARPGYEGRPTKGGDATKRIAEAFDANPEAMCAIARTTRELWERSEGEPADFVDVPDVDDPGEVEGRAILVSHLRRERNRKLRQRKIDAMRKHGALTCEVCGFNFEITYGTLGDGYIEVHHVLPLHASGETTTKLADLAVLCSNCHRMIHRRTPWLTPDELRSLVKRAV